MDRGGSRPHAADGTGRPAPASIYHFTPEHTRSMARRRPRPASAGRPGDAPPDRGLRSVGGGICEIGGRRPGSPGGSREPPRTPSRSSRAAAHQPPGRHRFRRSPSGGRVTRRSSAKPIDGAFRVRRPSAARGGSRPGFGGSAVGGHRAARKGVRPYESSRVRDDVDAPSAHVRPVAGIIPQRRVHVAGQEKDPSSAVRNLSLGVSLGGCLLRNLAQRRLRQFPSSSIAMSSPAAPVLRRSPTDRRTPGVASRRPRGSAEQSGCGPCRSTQVLVPGDPHQMGHQPRKIAGNLSTVGRDIGCLRDQHSSVGPYEIGSAVQPSHVFCGGLGGELDLHCRQAVTQIQDHIDFLTIAGLEEVGFDLDPAV